MTGDEKVVGKVPPSGMPPPGAKSIETASGVPAADGTNIRSISVLKTDGPPPTFALRDGRRFRISQAPPGQITGSKSFHILRTFEELLDGMEEWVEEEWFPSYFILLDIARTADSNKEGALGTALEKALASRLTPVARDKVSALQSFYLANIRFMATTPLAPMEVIESIEYLAREAHLRMETLANFDSRMRKLENDGFTESLPKPVIRRWQTARRSSRGLVHDVNNVLTGIMGLSSLASVTDNTQAFFASIKRFSIDTVESAMLMCRKLYATRALKNGVGISVNNNGDVALPEGFRFRLFRAMSELMLNAIKNCDEDKPAYNEATKEQVEGHRFVRTEYETDGDILTIMVSDNGVGMTEDELARAFQEGVTLRPDVSGGHGLGLPTIKSFAEKHGGSLELISKPGVGTTARLTVDLSTTGFNGPRTTGTPGGGGTPPATSGASGMPGGCAGGGNGGNIVAMARTANLAMASMEAQFALSSSMTGVASLQPLAFPGSSSMFVGMPRAVGF